MKSPQIRFDDKRFIFSISGESITATFDGVTDIFDFTDMPDGAVDSSMIDTVLEYSPIIRAERIDGLLSIELLNFVSIDADSATMFPDWEVING